MRWIAGLLVVALSSALIAAPPACVGLPLEHHGYGSYLHADDAAKAKLPGVKLDPDWSPHILDDPGNPHIPPDWCDRAKKAFKDHPGLPPQSQRQVP